MFEIIDTDVNYVIDASELKNTGIFDDTSKEEFKRKIEPYLWHICGG